MKPIAIFHHSRLSGGEPHIDLGHAVGIFEEQMIDFAISGLMEAARFVYFGVNGGPSDHAAASSMAPEKAIVIEHPIGARGELPTLWDMQQWLPAHQDWYVYYSHLKGAIHKGEPMYDLWRQRMQHACVTKWEQCVSDLEKGADAVGIHWLTPEQFGPAVKAPFFGGNFWWAKASFLLTLPPIKKTAITRADFYDAESWIGWGPRRPKIVDYYPGWP